MYYNRLNKVLFTGTLTPIRISPVRTLIVFLPIFQIGPKTFNLIRMFLRDDTLQ